MKFKLSGVKWRRVGQSGARLKFIQIIIDLVISPRKTTQLAFGKQKEDLYDYDRCTFKGGLVLL